MKYRLIQPTKALSWPYLMLPIACLIGLIIAVGFALPLHFKYIDAIEQHQILLNNKHILSKALISIKDQVLQLKDIDTDFSDLIEKYHFSWGNILWLTHLQMLAHRLKHIKPGIELQKIKLSEQKAIKVGDKLCNAQFIDIELEAGYTAFIHWLKTLEEQPALLGIQRLLLMESSLADHVHARIVLAIYYPEE